MLLKRTSPNLFSAFAGTGIEFGDQTFTGQILSQKRQSIQVPRGNCDHIRKAPVFYQPPTHHKRRPGVIEEAKKLLERAYFKPKKILSKVFYPGRKKNSQRREAVIRVTQVILQFLDLESLELGFYDNTGRFVRLDLKYIAKQAKLTLIRAKRALSEIMKAGYIESDKQYKHDDNGDFIGLAAIRKMTVRFFMDLGIDHLGFFSAREWKRKRQEKSLAKRAHKKIRGILKTATQTFTGKKISHPKPVVINKEKNIISKALEMAKEVGISVSEAYKMLKNRRE